MNAMENIQQLIATQTRVMRDPSKALMYSSGWIIKTPSNSGKSITGFMSQLVYEEGEEMEAEFAKWILQF